jgi:hypothetical protein
MRSVRVRRRPNRYSTWNHKKTTLFSGHYLRNRSTLDIGVLGYIGVIEGSKDRQNTTDFLRDANFIGFATCFGLCRPSSGQ